MMPDVNHTIIVDIFFARSAATEMKLVQRHDY